MSAAMNIFKDFTNIIQLTSLLVHPVNNDIYKLEQNSRKNMKSYVINQNTTL